MTIYVINECDITGPKQDRDALVALMVREVHGGHPIFDFNHIIPKPLFLRTSDGLCVRSLFVGFAILACGGDLEARWALETLDHRFRIAGRDPLREIYDGEFNGVITAEEMVQKARQALVSFERTDYAGQLDWLIKHWGTAEEGLVDRVSHAPDVLHLDFTTYWSFPKPALKALSDRFPDLDFTCRWQAFDRNAHIYGSGVWRRKSKRDRLMRRRPRIQIQRAAEEPSENNYGRS